MSKQIHVSIRLDEDLYQAIIVLATQERRERSDMVRILLQDGITTWVDNHGIKNGEVVEVVDKPKGKRLGGKR